ncbi:transcriptional regulator [Archaeoglobales archaeon]|nr:MAG: transcriptional regulator [Archaeoglobales archaeon]
MNLLKLVIALIRGDEEFVDELKRVLQSQNISVAELSRRANVPYTTLYKIMKRQRKPNLNTLRAILQVFYEEKDSFVAVIAARHVLEEIDFKTDRIRFYPSTNIEDALISAVRAEKEGAKAIVCAPIISSIVEKMVDVPVITIKPRDSLVKAIESALRRIG